jgi:hypothetical protein
MNARQRTRHEQKLLAIVPGVGIGDLKFGASCAEVRRIFGEPSHINEDADPDVRPGCHRWRYDELGLFVAFDPSGRVDMFEVRNPLARIEGHRIIGQPVEAAAALLRDLYPDLDINAQMIDEDSVEQLRVLDLDLHVWCEGGPHVESVSWADELPVVH